MGGGAVALLAACGAAASGGAPAAQQPQPVVAAAHGPNVAVSMSIDTPDMLGTDTGPAYVPSGLTLPSNTDVTVTIYNFDDATALTGPAVKFATATGIIGSLQTEPMDAANPNGPATGPATGAMSIDPTTVSHTFTVPGLGLNVPLAAQSRTTFTFHTGAEGTYEWHCMDPCGTGDTGWGGAMAVEGYMAGTLRVV
jgi:hypothetical protein